ncbi:AraC-like DNA-binding protein [Chryseobacterium sp. SORGH_AS 447]|uniref:helix-turn-helix domain-containing protein n=1 Tax=Chryseobacterium sp. SORGH_AS_0447 TaxID=3041769 RepID=UPI002782812B|nr:AraC family transcriptional regulator [Chryseobacterium sp. SORGH_AS_0447]MDQ1162406.1 AraC-like DNA-binding protein [Chryseobacterium sp. SORGH_AS_0447]
MQPTLDFKLIQPDDSLRDFVCCFSSMHHFSHTHEAVVIPNGRIDLIFSKTKDNRIQVALLGLETQPKYPDQEFSDFCSVSFNPLATEYIFGFPMAGLINSGMLMPDDFWGFQAEDLNDFEGFCQKMTEKIKSLLPENVDVRKRRLFELIFASNGEISIAEISEKISWSQRQINRYFNQQFGLPLKSYCKILRFQASLSDIKNGNLYPQLNFTDQSHFIKEITKFSGVSPKELHKNENGRFLQFLVYGEK